MKICFLDVSCGASGDMILGSLLDLGIEPARLTSELKKLSLRGYSLRLSEVERAGFRAKRLEVVLEREPHQPSRGLKEIAELIGKSSLSERAKIESVGIFRRLAEAEASAHGSAPEEVHFHEVGAADSIVDIVGTVVALELLGVEKVYSSAFSEGSGFVETAHGKIPVPAPATAELLKGFPVTFGVREGEMTTPTGAAIVTTLTQSVGKRVSMKVLGVGRGAGAADPPGLPNVVRAFLGEVEAESLSDEVWLLETNLDDYPGELFEMVFERLFRAGALDVFVSPIVMKKGRPAHLLSVLADEKNREALEAVIFSETSTFGVRRIRMERSKLDRSFEVVNTPFGDVRVKVGRFKGRVITASPEYEDLKRIAVEKSLPLREVLLEAQVQAAKFLGRK